jgi:glycosyltransferase involved in cell wall biosynthesis
MKIAQVAPLHESVPPACYGGTERIVSYLTEELVRAGHDVTLFASGDSVTAATLVASCAHSLRLDPECTEPLPYHVLQLEEVCERAEEFDIIHCHTDLHYPLARKGNWPCVTTLHGRLDVPGLAPLFEKFRDAAVVSISNSQREPLPWLNWAATVYHGLPLDCYRLCEKPRDYLVFVGRISPEKRVDRAVDIAGAAGMPLKVAAKIADADRRYVDEEIRPFLDEPFVEFVGEVGDAEKQELLGNARALLFPIDWAEPFGLVMIEAMACGTPVIAYRNGSVPEIICDGVTGFIVGSIDDAVGTLGKVADFDRRRCRLEFERRFSAARMARDYVAVYEGVAETNRHPRARSRSVAGESAAAAAVAPTSGGPVKPVLR